MALIDVRGIKELGKFHLIEYETNLDELRENVTIIDN